MLEIVYTFPPKSFLHYFKTEVFKCRHHKDRLATVNTSKSLGSVTSPSQASLFTFERIKIKNDKPDNLTNDQKSSR